MRMIPDKDSIFNEYPEFYIIVVNKMYLKTKQTCKTIIKMEINSGCSENFFHPIY